MTDNVAVDLDAVLQMTISGFLKFQLKRKPLGQDGTATFLKQATKLIGDVESTTPAAMDSITAAAVRYARNELETDPVFSSNWPPEVRLLVLADLVAAFKTLTESMFNPALTPAPAPAPAPASAPASAPAPAPAPAPAAHAA